MHIHPVFPFSRLVLLGSILNNLDHIFLCEAAQKHLLTSMVSKHHFIGTIVKTSFQFFLIRVDLALNVNIDT